MDTLRPSRPCCFDLKMGTKIILSAESIILTWVLVSAVITLIEADTRYASDDAKMLIYLSLLVLLCNIIGLFGIQCRKPTMLIPTFICKILAAIFLIGSIYFAFREIGSLIFMLGGVIVAFATWIVTSAIVVFLCYKQMKEDPNNTGPLLNGQPYNPFVNQPV